MLNLRYILQLVMNGLNDGSFANHYLVKQRHELVFHVALDSGDQMDPLIKQKLKQFLGYVALVAIEFAKQAFDHIRQWIPVINVACCEAKGKEFSTVIDNEMQLKAIEPTHCGLSPLGNIRENLVGVNPVVVANGNMSGIHKRYASAVSLSGQQVAAQGKQCTGLKFHEAIVTNQVRKCPTQIGCYLLGIVVFECPIARTVKPDDDCHDFTERQFAFSHASPEAIFQLHSPIFWLESYAKVINCAEKLYELCYTIISHQELLC